MKKIILTLISLVLILMFSFVIFPNNMNEQDYNMQTEKNITLTMPLNNVISGEIIYPYDSNTKGVFAYITQNNNLWVKDIGAEYDPVLDNLVFIMDNALSVKAFYDNGILVLKKDKSVWVRKHDILAFKDNTYIDDEYTEFYFNKIFDNAIMIDMTFNNLIFILKDDNSLWAYGNNYKFNGKTYEAINEPQQIMNNVKYVQSNKLMYDISGKHYLITIKNDGTLFQSQLYFISDKEHLPLRVEIGKEYKVMDNVVAADIRDEYGLAVKEGGDLFYWKQEDVLNNENFKTFKLTDNVKYTKLDLTGVTAYVLKNDGSLWTYGYLGDSTPFENGKKIHDNVYAILGDREIFIMDQEGNLIDAPYYCEDWDVKKPEYN